MPGTVDKEILIGFIEEVKSYLPVILEGIKTFRGDQEHAEKLETAYRHMHTIKGASSMVGLTGLSHIAYYAEETLEEIAAGQLSMTEEASALLFQTINQIEIYLEGLLAGGFNEKALLADITRAYRRLHDLPEEDDEAAVAEVLAHVLEDNGTNLEEESDLFDLSEVDSEDEIWLDEEDDEDDFGFEEDDEEIPAELMEIFSLEAEDHMRTISLQLAALDKEPKRKDLLQDVRRAVHTLKGAAGTVGFHSVAKLSHRMEDLLDLLYEDHLSIDSGIISLLFASAEALEDMISGKPVGEDGENDLQALYSFYGTLLDPVLAEQAEQQQQELSAASEYADEDKIFDLAEIALQLQEEDGIEFEPEDLLEVEAEIEPEIESEDEIEEEGKIEEPESTPKETEKKRQEVARPAKEFVRVPLDRLDELVRLISEVVITRTGFEQQMGNLVREVEELNLSLERLRRVSSKLETQYEASALGRGLVGPPENGGALGPVESSPLAIAQTHGFDELEFDRYTEFHLLSRELSETTSDIRTVGNGLSNLIGDFESILTRQGRLSSEIQDKLMKVRMVPLSNLSTRLHRAVRVVARKQGKQANLIIEGESVELDKTVLEEMADPLLHLLRNAVDHGIEPPALRQVMGKSKKGEIRLNAYYEGNQVIIQIKDDGAGLEPQLIRSKAISGGYVTESEAAKLTNEELYALLFVPGFSTAGEVSEISGRGVGMDIVKAHVNKLKGTLTLDSTPGEGTTFTISLPMTLAITRALLVRAHHETFAIPLGAITQIVRLERDEIGHIGQDEVIRIGGKVYPILSLGQLLHLDQSPDETFSRLPILILSASGKQIALVVDEIVEGREIVIKSLGNHLRRVHGVTGATIMGDGTVVLILNPGDLVSEPAQAEARAWTPSPTQTAEVSDTLNVMIVDDSLSVRRVVSNLIKNAGWQSITARDGLEALEIIQRSAQLPDLILLDIEMPRMDGYELTSTLRGQATYRQIPIVMLTSRAGEKHRRKAMEMGATEFMVKPYQDEVLLGLIRRLVREARGALA